MKIDHLAIWTKDLEASKEFYVKYFGAKAGEKYHNKKKNFESYFLSFGEGARVEIMFRPDIEENGLDAGAERIGLTHFAISLGSESVVNELTEILRRDGFAIVGEPRRTGDGYYESVVLDPEGNRIEIVA